MLPLAVGLCKVAKFVDRPFFFFFEVVDIEISVIKMNDSTRAW